MTHESRVILLIKITFKRTRVILSLQEKTRGSIHMAKKPLEKLLENPPETEFLFYDMSKLPIFGLYLVSEISS